MKLAAGEGAADEWLTQWRFALLQWLLLIAAFPEA